MKRQRRDQSFPIPTNKFHQVLLRHGLYNLPELPPPTPFGRRATPQSLPWLCGATPPREAGRNTRLLNQRLYGPALCVFWDRKMAFLENRPGCQSQEYERSEERRGGKERRSR